MDTAGHQPRSPKSRRRWFQFRLRTLLVLMTAVALWLGMKVDQARRQQRAVEHIRQCGGSVSYQASLPNLTSRKAGAPSRPWAPDWLCRLVGIDLVANVREIRLFGGKEAHDADLEVLEDLPGLEGLVICNSGITNDGLAHLSRLDQLKELVLESPQITDDGLAHLAALKELRYLELRCPVTDDGFRKLGTLQNLQTLYSYGYGTNLAAINNAIRNQRVPIEMIDMPMPDFFGYLSELLHTDWDALEQAGIDRKAFENLLVNEDWPNIELYTAFDRTLQPHGLAWTLGPKGFRVTTPATAAQKQSGLLWLKQQLPRLKEVHVSVEWQRLLAPKSAILDHRQIRR